MVLSTLRQLMTGESRIPHHHRLHLCHSAAVSKKTEDIVICSLGGISEPTENIYNGEELLLSTGVMTCRREVRTEDLSHKTLAERFCKLQTVN